MMSELPEPFGGPAPAELHLPRSPLAAVVVQVRFSSVLKLLNAEGLIPFQERARAVYPLFEQVTTSGFQFGVGPNGPAVQEVTGQVWKLMSADRAFVISLTSDAITLEAQTYPGRADFMARWSQLLEWVQETYDPALAVRCGMRYINRVAEDSISCLADWLTPGLIGVSSRPLCPHIAQSVSEANATVAEGGLLMRWGLLPPGVSISPDVLTPVDSRSCVLDIDVFNEATRPFEAEALSHFCTTLAERAYSVFRWSLSDQGLNHFGGGA